MFAFAILLCAAVLVTTVDEQDLNIDLSTSSAASTDSTPTDSAKEMTGKNEEAPLTGVTRSAEDDVTEGADTAETPQPHISEVVIDFDARPEWVEGDEEMNVGPIYRIAVSSGPHVRHRDARKELFKQLEMESNEYINDLLEHPRAAFWLGFDEDRVRSELVNSDRIYDETIISPSFGVMHQSHALLEFGPEFREETQVAWNDIVLRGRLVAVGLAGSVVMTVLCMFLAYFRADTATKGFYTGRLRFATILVILGLVAAGAVLARSIPWLWL